MSNLLFFIKISRPRFWFYLAGPFLIGSLSAVNNFKDLNNWPFYLLLLYFLIPANIYLYGINDYFDVETDNLNIKKDVKEIRLNNKIQRRWVLLYIIFFIAISIVIFFFLPNNLSKLFLALFLFLSTFYSAKPLRFKKLPFIDSLSNILYAAPGFFAYSLVTNNWPPIVFIFAALAWTAAMHLFSAIPDIAVDKKVSINTTAVFLGEKISLIICFLLWLLFSILIIFSGALSYLGLICLVYPLATLIIIALKIDASKVYWYFPFVNAVFGFLVFWYLVWLK